MVRERRGGGENGPITDIRRGGGEPCLATSDFQKNSIDKCKRGGQDIPKKGVTRKEKTDIGRILRKGGQGGGAMCINSGR